LAPKVVAFLRRAAGCCAEPLRQLESQKWAHTLEHQPIPQATALLMKVRLLQQESHAHCSVETVHTGCLAIGLSNGMCIFHTEVRCLDDGVHALHA